MNGSERESAGWSFARGVPVARRHWLHRCLSISDYCLIEFSLMSGCSHRSALAVDSVIKHKNKAPPFHLRDESKGTSKSCIASLSHHSLNLSFFASVYLLLCIRSSPLSALLSSYSTSRHIHDGCRPRRSRGERWLCHRESGVGILQRLHGSFFILHVNCP